MLNRSFFRVLVAFGGLVLLALAPPVAAEVPTLVVRFLDVGQADSLVLQQGTHALLIDAGNNADQKTVLGELDKLGLKRLDAVIGTHAHEDHIGAMDAVIKTREIGTVYFPRQTATTKTFRDFATAVKAKNLKLTAPKPGESFELGLAHVEFLAPARLDYEDPNEFSIVVRVTFGKTSFVLTGDASFESEGEMLASGRNLSATVLKVGHHGSATASSAAFLAAVHPAFAVISVGADNKYGHPTSEALGRLKAAGATVYRTDQRGLVTATSDGATVSWSFERS
ncbi:MAG: ComEC/Rec2 family competence protein [Spirochaetales bacterium]